MTAERDRFLDAATRIGLRLCRDAIWWQGRCNWLGWSMEPHGGQWIPVHRAMSSLVYDGTAGIGLFLASLARLSDEPVIRTTAEGALAQALTAVDPLAKAGEYGFYSGLSGIAWSCIEAGKALACDELVARGRSAMRRAAHLAPKEQRLDIINGSAGLILPSWRQQSSIGVAVSSQLPSGMASISSASRRGPIRAGPGTRSGFPTSVICSGSPMAHRASPMPWLRSAGRRRIRIFSQRRRKHCATSAGIFERRKAIGLICAASAGRDRPVNRLAWWPGATAHPGSASPAWP